MAASLLQHHHHTTGPPLTPSTPRSLIPSSPRWTPIPTTNGFMNGPSSTITNGTTSLCSPLDSPSSFPFHFPSKETMPPTSTNTPLSVVSPSLSLTNTSPIKTTTAVSTSKAVTVKRTRRKRCGQCKGCARTLNCGQCVVCRNPNSTHSMCKLRRCEALLQRPPLKLNGTVNNGTFTTTINGHYPNGIDSPHATPPPPPPLPPPINGFTLSQPVERLSSFHQRGCPPTKKKKRNSAVTSKKKREPPPCGCPGSDDGIYYTHLGAGSSPDNLRAMLEKRLNVSKEELRMLELTYTGIEAKTSEGCPTAEWIIRQKSEEEKFLVLYRHHRGHSCTEQYTVISIVYWNAFRKEHSAHSYRKLVEILSEHGQPTPRKCDQNVDKSCSCQGTNKVHGASYSFGCSWSVYYNGCKFARSKIPRKFRLQPKPESKEKEGELADHINDLATFLAPLYKHLAPKAYSNQVSTQAAGLECRLGKGEEKPFSGMTCCMDFCAHSHYDRHNMPDGGATVVVTILKEGVLPEEHARDDSGEQLHCLPLYRLKDPPLTSMPGVEVRPVKNEELPVISSTPVPTTTPVKSESMDCSPPNNNSNPFSISSILSSSTSSSSNLSLTNNIKQEHESFSSSITFHSGLNTPTINGFHNNSHLTNGAHTNGVHNNNHINNGFHGNVPENGRFNHSHNNGFHNNGLTFGNYKNGTVAPPHPQLLIDSSTDSDSDCYIVTDSPDPHTTPTKNSGSLYTIKEEPTTPTKGLFLHHINGINSTPPPTHYIKPLGATPPFYSHNNTSMDTIHPFDQLLTPAGGEMPLLLSSEGSLPSTAPPSPSDMEESVDNKPHPLTKTVTKNDRIHAIPGGVALALGHGSVLIECAKKELHATTAIKKPNRTLPTRLSMVFYQHKKLRSRNHGYDEEIAKQKLRQEEQRQRLLMEESNNLYRKPHPLLDTGLVTTPPCNKIPPTFRPGLSEINSSYYYNYEEEDDDPDCYFYDLYSGSDDESEDEMEPDDITPTYLQMGRVNSYMGVANHVGGANSQTNRRTSISQNNSSSNNKTVSIKVGEATRLTELEMPFYLEFPVYKISNEVPKYTRQMSYPCPFVQESTSPTLTLTYSRLKPTSQTSGNYSSL